MANVETRQVERDSLLLIAQLRVDRGDMEYRVKVRNLSAGGMMAEGAVPVARGGVVSVGLRNIGWIEGTVAWKQDETLGIAALSAAQGVLRIDERLRRTVEARITAPAAEPRDLLVEIAKIPGYILVPDTALAPTEETATAWRFALTLAAGESRVLAVRMDRHVVNAMKVAEYLEKHPAVAWVSYAGLPANRFHALAKKYLPKGAGAVFTFGVKGGFAAGVKVVEGVKLFSHLANIGDTRSLILHPASTTHRQLSDEQRLAAGAGPDVIRLSVGIESADDIIADLDQALAQAG